MLAIVENAAQKAGVISGATQVYVSEISLKYLSRVLSIAIYRFK